MRFWEFVHDLVLGLFSLFLEIIDRPLQSLLGDHLTYLKKPYWLPREEGTVLVTGGSMGLGKETVRALAELGYRVIFTSREEEKGKQTLNVIKDETGNPNIEMYVVDFSRLSEVREFGMKLKERNIPIHILVNNAGGMFRERTITDDGLESAFQINYLAHFLLTDLLMDNLKMASPPARIINISSILHFVGRIRFDDLQHKRWYYPSLAYADSKLAMILFTRELNKRLNRLDPNNKIKVVAGHPGPVDTALSRGYPEYMRLMSSLTYKPANWGARTHIYLCLAPPEKLVSGSYYADTRVMPVSSFARNPKLATALWMESEKLVRQREDGGSQGLAE